MGCWGTDEVETDLTSWAVGVDLTLPGEDALPSTASRAWATVGVSPTVHTLNTALLLTDERRGAVLCRPALTRKDTSPESALLSHRALIIVCAPRVRDTHAVDAGLSFGAGSRGSAERVEDTGEVFTDEGGGALIVESAFAGEEARAAPADLSLATIAVSETVGGGDALPLLTDQSRSALSIHDTGELKATPSLTAKPWTTVAVESASPWISHALSELTALARRAVIILAALEWRNL